MAEKGAGPCNRNTFKTRWREALDKAGAPRTRENGFDALRFLAQLAAPNTRMTTDQDVTYLIDVTTGSAASLTPGHGTWAVRQAGPLHLWDTIEATLTAWDQAGQPGPEQFRMLIDEHGQRIEHTRNAANLMFAL